MADTTIGRVRLLSWAKVNLSLRVLGHRQDGFHEVATVLQSISLGDWIEVEVTTNPAEWSVAFEGTEAFPAWEDGLIGLGREAFERLNWSNYGMKAMIRKEIPLSAGLGGSSADAAGLLRGLMILSQQDEALAELAPRAGSDVPGMLRGGRTDCRGRGERVRAMADPGPVWIGLLFPPVHCDTGLMYDRLEHGAQEAADTAAGCVGENDFQPLARALYREVDHAWTALKAAGAPSPLLSGSGGSVFVLDPSRMRVSDWLRKAHEDTGFPCRLCTSEPQGYKMIDIEWGVAKW